MLESMRRKFLEGAGSLLASGHKAVGEAFVAGEKALDREAKLSRVREIAAEVGMKVITAKEKVNLPADLAEIVEEARGLLSEISAK